MTPGIIERLAEALHRSQDGYALHEEQVRAVLTELRDAVTEEMCDAMYRAETLKLNALPTLDNRAVDKAAFQAAINTALAEGK